MGHLVGKEIYRKLGGKIDGLETRTPWNDKLYAILKELYTAEEADVVVRMPCGLSTLSEMVKATGYELSALARILEGLIAKGLVMDLWLNEEYRYMPSPMIIGIFEFTMMRTGGNLKSREWAKLFEDYLFGDASFHQANFGKGERISTFRALPHEGVIAGSDYAEVLDYEKASALLAEADKFAIGLCACRHKKIHLGEKECDVPLETCSSLGEAAAFMIRNNFAREVTRGEMEENFARSREMGLVMIADNVQKNVKFVCHCCGCCCDLLQGITKFGYPNIIVTSNFIPGINIDTCTGCGKCAKSCPVNAVTMAAAERTDAKRQVLINDTLCIGCGVCALKCPKKACAMAKRGSRVIHPETTFERVMLQSLEKGTLHNQIFANPKGLNEKFMRAFVGAFLKLPPVKKALLSDALRSRFLDAMKDGVRKQGKEWLLEM